MEQAATSELDRAVLEQARRGDKHAFASLVQHYQKPVHNLAYRMLGSVTDAEDAAQETFLRAYAQMKSYRTDSSFSTWLLSIAAHYCIDRLRRRRRPFWLSLDEGHVSSSLPAADASPEETAMTHEQAEQVQHLLHKLTPAYRAVIVLKYWNDLPVEQIARATGDRPSAVKVKLFRARQAMAREMQQQTRQEGLAPRGLQKAVSRVR